jgi:hypothetical protein
MTLEAAHLSLVALYGNALLAHLGQSQIAGEHPLVCCLDLYISGYCGFFCSSDASVPAAGAGAPAEVFVYNYPRVLSAH